MAKTKIKPEVITKTDNEIPWTAFWDMHSGGRTKEPPYEKIFIQAPEDEAKTIFYNRFGHNPERVTCTYGGTDYSISESKTLEHATGYHRGCRAAVFDKQGKEVPENKKTTTKTVNGKKLTIHRTYLEFRYVDEPSTEKYQEGKYKTLPAYLKGKDVLVIDRHSIADSERVGEVPQEGYVWV